MMQYNMLKISTKKLVFCLLAILLLFSSVSGCGKNSDTPEVVDEAGITADQSSSPGDTETEGTDPDAPNSGSPGQDAMDENGYIPVAPDIEDSALPGSEPSDEPVQSTEPYTGGPDLPLQEPAEDDYFSDAAFVGNSLMDGFRLFSGLDTCTYYAATSMTVVGVDSSDAITLDNGYAGTIMQALGQKTFGKIYILLGINEIGFEASYFKQLYSDMLDEIKQIQPDADIYIMSLTPVSEYKSSTDKTFTMSRVKTYNEVLYELAGEKECFYMDLCEALCDEKGYLPSTVTSDGVHFSASHYKVWLDYVKTHYV